MVSARRKGYERKILLILITQATAKPTPSVIRSMSVPPRLFLSQRYYNPTEVNKEIGFRIPNEQLEPYIR